VTDPLSRAYALLDLAPGASPELVRKQYKALVRRWHPDRFAGDPQGQSEAALRMRAINDAYHLILQRSAPGAPVSPPRPPRPAGQPLSREEIDRIVHALGTDGPVDLLLASLRVVGRAVWIPFAIVSLALLGLRVVFALLGGEWGAGRGDLEVLLFPVVVSVAATAWYFQMKAQRGRG
jgi:DnaJ domain